MLHQTPANVGRVSQADKIRSVTEETFTRLVLDGDGPIVVEFMSYGCAYCRALEPVLQEVAEMLKSTHTIFRVNTAVARDLSSSYEIDGTPTFVMFLNGQEVGRAQGPHPTVSSLMATLTQAFES